MIDNLIKQALKSGNKVELKVYRNLKADILTFKTQKNAKPFTNDTFYALCQKYCKKLEDSISEFSKAAREDLVSECRDELEVLKKLLPEPVTESELIIWITNTCIERNWTSKNNDFIKIVIPKKEMGKFIKEVKSAFPTVDGKMIADIIKQNLE